METSRQSDRLWTILMESWCLLIFQASTEGIFHVGEHTELNCRVGCHFLAFALLQLIILWRKLEGGGRACVPGPFVFPSLACPVTGKPLRCPSPSPGIWGSMSLPNFTESSSQAPHTSQADLTSGNGLSRCCFHLNSKLATSSDVFPFCVFSFPQNGYSIPVKGIAVIPV